MIHLTIDDRLEIHSIRLIDVLVCEDNHQPTDMLHIEVLFLIIKKSKCELIITGEENKRRKKKLKSKKKYLFINLKDLKQAME